MTARDLTSTERAIRVLVAQHLPGIPADMFGAYANHIHPATPFGQLGLADVDLPNLLDAVEGLYAIELSDDERASAKTVAALARVIDGREIGRAEAA